MRKQGTFVFQEAFDSQRTQWIFVYLLFPCVELSENVYYLNKGNIHQELSFNLNYFSVHMCGKVLRTNVGGNDSLNGFKWYPIVINFCKEFSRGSSVVSSCFCSRFQSCCPGEKFIYFKQVSLHAKKVLSFMLLEQLCLTKLAQNPPGYSCKKIIFFQHEFSYKWDVRPRLLSNAAPHIFSRL